MNARRLYQVAQLTNIEYLAKLDIWCLIFRWYLMWFRYDLNRWIFLSGMSPSCQSARCSASQKNRTVSGLRAQEDWIVPLSTTAEQKIGKYCCPLTDLWFFPLLTRPLNYKILPPPLFPSDFLCLSLTLPLTLFSLPLLLPFVHQPPLSVTLTGTHTMLFVLHLSFDRCPYATAQ